MLDLETEAAAFLSPSEVLNRDQALARPSTLPKQGGVYGWWFDVLPGRIDPVNCRRWHGLTLLYTGISPKRPPTNGKPPSRGQLRQRIETHYAGNAEGSTLRKTLGCLLADELGIDLRRVGSGKRRTFGVGERQLSSWMAAHAYVSYVTHAEPWDLETLLIRTVDLPLNLQGNASHPFHMKLTQVRASCTARANALPILANPGIGGR